MGTCESLFKDNKTKVIPREDMVNRPNNAGKNFFAAPINNSTTNDINQTTLSQMTMDVSQHFEPPKKPQFYQYINKYKTNGLQRSIVKASLVEMKGQGNSLMFSGIKGSRTNQTNSLYTSRADDTGYDSSYDQCEMIVDGKMDVELVKKNCDKNTINNYNEFIGKKDSLKINNNKIMDYCHKKKELNIIQEDNKDQKSDLSIIPSTPQKKDNKKIITGIY